MNEYMWSTFYCVSLDKNSDESCINEKYWERISGEPDSSS